jgi:NADH-quinone oxidoreductase subunit I
MTLASYIRNTADAIVTTAKGMRVTFRVFCKVQTEGGVTIQYPEERDTIPVGSRGLLFNDIHDCIACGQCANVCPSSCITIESAKRASGDPPTFTRAGTKKTLELRKYTIDTSLCCYCGLCVASCPTNCLYHTMEYEYSALNRDKHIIDYLNYDR